MPIVKKYVTWKAKKINEFRYEHPNTDGRASSESNGDINFIETAYQLNGVYIGIAEHEGNLPQARLDALLIKDPAFEFYSATEGEVNQLLHEAYGETIIDDLVKQCVCVNNHIFEDLRPKDVI